jgi:LytR cell envelope-related transcriptional attenuator
VEHAQPFTRPLPRRTVVLVGLLFAVVLLVAGGFALALQARSRHVVREAQPAGRVTPPTPLRPRSRISVLVLNGNGVENAAGAAATRILARGYRRAVPADAPNLDYARSLVLFRPGWQREAERLGKDARIATVAPLDGSVAPAYARVPLVVILGAN